MTRLLLAALLVLPALGARAAGRLSTAQFLEMQPDARSLAMGEAGQADAEGARGLTVNPAALHGVKAHELFFTHALLGNGIGADHAAYGGAFGSYRLGLAYRRLGYGQLEGRDDSGSLNGDFSPADTVMALSAGAKLSGLKTALTVKRIDSKIVTSPRTTAVDFGARWDLDEEWSLGASAHNLGGDLRFETASEPLPKRAAFGGAWRPAAGWTLAADLVTPFHSPTYGALGFERAVRLKDLEDRVVAFRLGFNTKTPDAGRFAGLKAGVGARFGPVEADYAFGPGGDASSWQGNANAQFTPAMKISDSWGLIPTYAAAYQGTRSVAELGSGGQLFQDSMSHSLRLRSIHKRGNLKLNPQFGYRWELLRETTDEGWGRGLFDFRKPSAGLEAEYAFNDRVSGGAGVDWYQIRFPNFATLESSVKGQGLGRVQASARTLDNNNLAWSGWLAFPSPLPETRARVSVSWTDRTFPEQNLVTASGQLESRRRADSVKTVALSLGRGWRLGENAGVFAELQGSWTRLDSAQNHYDAGLNRFNPNYYSFEERQIMPRATFVLGKRKVEASLAYLNTRREFVSRPAQDARGSYTDDQQVLEQDTFMLDLAIPLKHGFKFLAASHIATARSNQRYERFFKTNYTLQTHMLGFSYKY